MQCIRLSGTTVSITIATILAIVFVLGNPVHALISHEHGDHHGAHEGASAIWQSLHASLRHDDKKMLSVASVLLIVAVVCCARRVYTYGLHKTFVDSLDDFLRRGRAPHRAFG